MKKRAIILHPAIAPYRVDFFNSLAKEFDASFYFEFDNACLLYASRGLGDVYKRQLWNRLLIRKNLENDCVSHLIFFLQVLWVLRI